MWPFSRRPDSALKDVAAELKGLRDFLSTRDTLEEPARIAAEPDSDLILRLESLEGRFEELRGQCLRHLQSASQRLKLAERKEEELEDAGEMPVPPNGSQITLPIPEDAEPVSDLEWARREMMRRGETPVTGA